MRGSINPSLTLLHIPPFPKIDCSVNYKDCEAISTTDILYTFFVILPMYPSSYSNAVKKDLEKKVKKYSGLYKNYLFDNCMIPSIGTVNLLNFFAINGNRKMHLSLQNCTVWGTTYLVIVRKLQFWEYLGSPWHSNTVGPFSLLQITTFLWVRFAAAHFSTSDRLITIILLDYRVVQK